MDIFQAAKEGKWAEISKFVGEIESLDQDGNTALMVAAKSGHLSTVRSLIKSGAQLNTLGKGLHSALSLACKAGRTEVVMELLGAGASVKTVTEDGSTALYFAADSNAPSMVEFLLRRGANGNLPRDSTLTPLVIAAHKGFYNVVRVLLKHNADPNLTTSEAGNSALYWASHKGFHSIAKALLDAGANPYHGTMNGNTPLSATSEELMRRLILSYQADGPSWLVQQLWARGLEWPAVCDVEDKLLKEGFVSKEVFLSTPTSQFTHEYLRSIGILQFGTRQIVITVRLEGTWLGARLAALGVSAFWIRSCETCVFEALGCRTKTAYANLPLQALSAEALKEVGVPAQYHLVLRALHEQLNNKAQQAREEKKTSTAVTSARDNGAT
eukprot:gene16661-19001_t